MLFEEEMGDELVSTKGGKEGRNSFTIGDAGLVHR